MEYNFLAENQLMDAWSFVRYFLRTKGIGCVQKPDCIMFYVQHFCPEVGEVTLTLSRENQQRLARIMRERYKCVVHFFNMDCQIGKIRLTSNEI